MSNNEHFEKRKNIVKITWTILFVVSVIALIILGCKTDNDGAAVGISAFAMLLIYWNIFCIVFWICSLIGVKFKTYLYNEHEISFYLGWGCGYMLLDDVIVDKHTGSFVGARPLECDLNGEKIYLEVGAFTLNNYTLRIGNKILH